MDIVRKFRNYKSHIGVFGLRISGIVFSYTFTTLVSKKSGNDSWGLFAITLSILSIGVLFGKFGFDTAMLRFSSQYQQDKKAYTGIFIKFVPVNVLLTIILSFLLFFSSDYIGKEILNSPSLGTFLKTGSICLLPYTYFLILSELLRGCGKSLDYSFIQVTGLYLFSSLSFVVLYHLYPGSPKEIVIWSFAAAAYFLFIYAILRSIPLLDTLKARSPLTLKQIFSICWPMFLSNATFVIFEWSDMLMIGYFSKEPESIKNTLIGTYNICFKLSNFVNIPLVVTNSLIAPKIASLYFDGKKTELGSSLRKNQKIVRLATIIIVLIMILSSHGLIRYFELPEREGLTILIILITGHLIINFCGPVDLLLLMTGNEKIYQRIMFFSIAVNLAANLVLIPVLGIAGAAVSNLAFKILSTCIAQYYIAKKLHVPTLLFKKSL